MNRIERGIAAAADAAKLSERRRAKTGAAIFLGNRLVAIGFNNYRSNPRQRVGPFRWEHAETNCLVGSNKLDLGRAILYVARVHADGTIHMARPCPDCQRILLAAGVYRVWYSNEKGNPARLW